MKRRIPRNISLSMLIAIFLTGFLSNLAALGLESTAPLLKDNLQIVNKTSSNYFSEHLPFMASLGKNDYRAALKGGILPVSFLVSAGFGVGLMGQVDDINMIGGQDFISSGSYPASIPFLIGPTLYLRLGVPILPVIGNFEIGFKYVTPLNFKASDFEYKNNGYGLDLRYAILRGSNLLFPALAIGVSYDTLKGNFTRTGEVATTLGTISAQMGPDWNIWNLDVYAKVSSQLLSLLSLTLGASMGIRGGETVTGVKNLTFGGASFDNFSQTTKASGTDFKVMAGISVFVFYVEVNRNLTTGDNAVSMAATYSF